MQLRLASLVAAGVAVLAMGVYLFIQVRAAPAHADGSPAPVHHVAPPPTAAPSPEETPAAGSDAAPATVDVAGTLRAPRPHVMLPTAADDGSAVDDGSARRPHVRTGFVRTADGLAPADPKLGSLMLEANKAYDRGDIDEAKQIAQKILADDPKNARMLRVMVSAACIDGDATTARTYYAQLNEHDRGQMRLRCDRYGVTFGSGE